MKISEHIKGLLYEHECVIIPNFGGFIAQYQEAKIDVLNAKMHPPIKIIAFNQNLKANDALLITQISNAENISYSQAETRVTEYVSKLNTLINSGKKVKISEVGSFHKQKGALVFTPEHFVNFNSDTFGLDSFEFPMLQGPTKQKITQRKQLEPIKSKRKRPSLVPLLVGIPLVAAMAYMPLFFQNNVNTNNNEVAGISIPLNFEIKKSEPTELLIPKKTLELKKVDIENAIKVKTIEQKVPTTVKPIIETPITPKYTAHIIAGSYANRAKAEVAIKQLNNKGFEATIMESKQGRSRIVLKSYTTAEQAINELESMRKAVNNNTLWVLKD